MPSYALTVGFKDKHRQEIIALLQEYERAIGVSLCFQDFAAELTGLPGEYTPPGGEFILLRNLSGGQLLGCVALRAVPGAPDLCEMKRLYVRAAAQGHGLGRKLALAAMAQARRLGYTRMCLDTLPSMTAAQALYRSLGFRQIGETSTHPNALLFEREL